MALVCRGVPAVDGSFLERSDHPPPGSQPDIVGENRRQLVALCRHPSIPTGNNNPAALSCPGGLARMQRRESAHRVSRHGDAGRLPLARARVRARGHRSRGTARALAATSNAGSRTGRRETVTRGGQVDHVATVAANGAPGAPEFGMASAAAWDRLTPVTSTLPTGRGADHRDLEADPDRPAVRAALHPAGAARRGNRGHAGRARCSARRCRSSRSRAPLHAHARGRGALQDDHDVLKRRVPRPGPATRVPPVGQRTQGTELRS